MAIQHNSLYIHEICHINAERDKDCRKILIGIAENKKKSSLIYTRGITSKRVVSGRTHLRSTVPKKRRGDGELLVALCRFDRPDN